MEEIDGSVVQQMRQVLSNRDVWMRCVMWQMWQVMRMPSSQDVQMEMLSQDARMRGVELRWLLSQDATTRAVELTLSQDIRM